MHMYFDGETCVSKTTCGEHEDYIPESNTCKCSQGYHKEEQLCVKDNSCDATLFLVLDPSSGNCKCMDGYEENADKQCVVSKKKSSDLIVSLSVVGAVVVATAIGVFVWLRYKKRIEDELYNEPILES